MDQRHRASCSVGKLAALLVLWGVTAGRGEEIPGLGIAEGFDGWSFFVRTLIGFTEYGRPI